jgi:hypothetical protein
VRDTDLLIIVPWAIFAAGVATVTMLAFASGRRRPGRILRRRRGRPRRR